MTSGAVANEPDEEHYDSVVRELAAGSVVPLLGAGVNVCGRPAGLEWQAESGLYLPSGSELAEYLASRFSYPTNGAGTTPAESTGANPAERAQAEEPSEKETGSRPLLDLLRVSQYVTVKEGSGPLYRELKLLFDSDYPPTAVHQFFARLPQTMCPLIVTTNYDDVLERAFGKKCDVLWYIADPAGDRGKFWHLPAGAKSPTMINKANTYSLALDGRTVILKIHGAVDRSKKGYDSPNSFVITEDHYIDYLTQTDLSKLLPAAIINALRHSHFLFLGYSMSDWNLRVILHRIWGEQPLSYSSWAIRTDVDRVESALWGSRDVKVFDIPLERYIAELERRI